MDQLQTPSCSRKRPVVVEGLDELTFMVDAELLCLHVHLGQHILPRQSRVDAETLPTGYPTRGLAKAHDIGRG